MKKRLIIKESDLKRIIEQKLIEESWNNFDWDDVLGGGDMWSDLERDLSDCIQPLIEKYADRGKDSYEVIDMMFQILDGMFQRVK